MRNQMFDKSEVERSWKNYAAFVYLYAFVKYVQNLGRNV